MPSIYAYKTKAAFHSEGYEAFEQGDCNICTKQICSVDAKLHEHGTEEDETEPGIKITACGHVLGKECALKWWEEANSCPFCRVKLFPSGSDWTEEFAPLLAQLEEKEAEEEPVKDITDLLAKFGFEFE
jgi:hypothetical protein